MKANCSFIVIVIGVLNLTGAWDWHFRELRRLHEGADTCLNLTYCDTVEKLRYAKGQCYSYFLHFSKIPARMRTRCPDARNARCRLHEGAERCTVQINASAASTEAAEPGLERIVPLDFCIEHFREWDRLVEWGAPEEPTTARAH